MTGDPGGDRRLQLLLDLLGGSASVGGRLARDQLLATLRSTGVLGAGEEFAAALESFAEADGEERRRIVRELLRLDPARPAPPPPSATVVPPPGPAGPAADHHPLVEGLLRQLPAVDGTWSAAQRQRWLDLAGLILDSLFVVEPDSVERDSGKRDSGKRDSGGGSD